MQLLDIVLVLFKRRFYLLRELLTEVQLLGQVHLIDIIYVFIAVKMFKSTQDFKELNLSHSFLVNLHFAPKQVHPLLLQRVFRQLNNTSKILSE